jgi:glutathione S-transferase
MKLYDSVGPNPRVVRMFAAERGVPLELAPVDLMKGENRQEPHLARNPSGQMPTLETDSGMMLSEITAICEYLDEKGPPGGSLIGATPEERANTRMWTRRIDLNICEPMANGFRFGEGLALFQNRIRCIPEASAGLKQVAKEKLTWLDGLIAGREFVAGPKLTMADVLLFAFIDFGGQVGQPLDAANKNLTAWFERMKARPSAAA